MHQMIVALRVILVVLVCVTEAVSKTDYLETLLVEDHLICKHHSVILDVDGTKQVPAFYFAANTKGFSEIRIRRAEMNPGSCGFDRSNEFGKAAVFCCGDVGQEVYIELTAINAKGESKQCMIQVDVFTGGTLNVDQCLPNITVTCDFPVDLNNLSNFGTFVKEEHLQQPIIINGLPVGKDGLVQFKCSTDPIIAKKIQINEIVEVEETIGCGQGYSINRTMQLTDRGGVMSECVQVITILPDNTPLSYYDITWPSDTTVFGCADVNADPLLLGEPITKAADCENILVNYEDELLSSRDAACTKLLRRWSVIDWCTYEYNGKNQGKWDHTQIIRIENTVKPDIYNCDDLEICVNENSCEAVLNYTLHAADECHPYEDLKYTYSLFLNGDDDNGRSGRSQTVTEYLPIGEHVLYWSVSDGCNNIQDCSHRVTVYDCKAPSVFCLTGFTGTLTDNGLDEDPSLEIWASDFVSKAFDNCTPVEELSISLSADTLDQVIYYDCSHVGINDIEIFVTDPKGQQSSCRTSFIIQDNIGVCGDGRLIEAEENEVAALIAGQVNSPSGAPISDVQIELAGLKMKADVSTNDEGQYQFENIPMNEEYTITPSKEGYSKDGISVLDLVLLQQHILGLNNLNSPYHMIAGDVNATGTISAADLVELKTFLIGRTDSFKSNEAWRFIDEAYTFIDPSHPWPFTDEAYISNLKDQTMVKNFIGVKIGDLDQSNTASSVTRTQQTIPAKLVQREEGQMLSEWSEQVLALSLSWTSQTFDEIKLSGEAIGKDDLAISKIGQVYQYRLIIQRANGAKIDLSTLHIETSGAFLALKAEVVTVDFTEVEISFSKNASVQNLVEIFPNPFSSSLSLQMNSATQQSADISVFNAIGQKLHHQRVDLVEGKNEIQMNQLDEVKSGILYVQTILADGSRDIQTVVKAQ